MHPAHVPLEAEAQAALVGGAGDGGPGGGLLGNGAGIREVAVDHLVEAAEEGHGLQVLPAPVAVGDPLSLFAAVVQVEHRGHGVHPEAVDVIAVEPEQGVGDEEVLHLGAAEVEDQGAPVHVPALAGVRVLIEVRAIELPQAVAVLGEVGRNPVQDHPQARLVQGVHEALEVLRPAEAAGRGKEPQGLVAPGGIEGMLHDRQQLYVGEAQPADVGRQIGSDLPVGHVAAVGPAAPGAQVQLVDADGGLVGAGAAPGLQPGAIPPGVVLQAVDDGGRAGGRLTAEGKGIGLQGQQVPLGAVDLELVQGAHAHAGHEGLPEAVGAGLAQGVAAAIPAVEVPDHTDRLCIGRPDGEGDAVHPPELSGVSAEFFVGPQVGTFPQQVQIQIAQSRGGVARFHGPF